MLVKKCASCSCRSNTDAAKLSKDKYEKLLDEHYTKAKSTVFGSWQDSEMRDWLVNHGFVKSNAQLKREEASPPAQMAASIC